jgi:hypothetical protein
MPPRPQNPEGGEEPTEELQVATAQAEQLQMPRDVTFEYGYLSPRPPQDDPSDSWDEWVIEEGIKAALREGRSIDDRTAHYIAAQLHEGQDTDLYSLSSTGHVGPSIDAELAQGYHLQTDQARKWIRWLSGYCAFRQDLGSMPNWTESAAAQDRADSVAIREAERERDPDWLDSLFGEQASEEVGSVDELGWYGLVRHDGRPGGYVLRQDEQGFRHVWETDSQAELDELWANVGQLYEEFHRDVESQTTDEENRPERDDPPIPELPRRLDGDGYDWMEQLPRGWVPVASWGREGWDLGSWPYAIVVEYRNAEQGVYAVGTYVEGDITVQRFETATDQYEAIDTIAEFYWRADPSRGPQDLPEGEGLLPHHRRPYVGDGEHEE